MTRYYKCPRKDSEIRGNFQNSYFYSYDSPPSVAKSIATGHPIILSCYDNSPKKSLQITSVLTILSFSKALRLEPAYVVLFYSSFYRMNFILVLIFESFLHCQKSENTENSAAPRAMLHRLDVQCQIITQTGTRVLTYAYLSLPLVVTCFASLSCKVERYFLASSYCRKGIYVI